MYIPNRLAKGQQMCYTLEFERAKTKRTNSSKFPTQDLLKRKKIENLFKYVHVVRSNGYRFVANYRFEYGMGK